MAEYIVRTDIEEARWKAMGADYSTYFNNKVTTFMGNPVIERIVRCRDCKWLIPESDENDNECDCPQWQGYAGLRNEVELNGFCSWGLPKEGE